MITHANSPRRALICACALAALVAVFPSSALAATHTSSTPTFPVPASARVNGTSTAPTTTTAPATTTTAPATTTPATITPANTVPSTTTPATGTTVPSATTPAGSVAPSTPTPAATIPSTTPPTGSTTAVGVVHKSAPSKTRLSTGALALAILAALLALGCVFWVLARWLALEPRWTLALMRSLDEASFRASATWAEFSDWARIGR